MTNKEIIQTGDLFTKILFFQITESHVSDRTFKNKMETKTVK